MSDEKPKSRQQEYIQRKKDNGTIKEVYDAINRCNIRRYQTNEEYRVKVCEKFRNYKRERYNNDEEFRERIKEQNRKQYQKRKLKKELEKTEKMIQSSTTV